MEDKILGRVGRRFYAALDHVRVTHYEGYGEPGG